MNSLRTKAAVIISLICFCTIAILVGYNLYRMKIEVQNNISLMRQTLMEQLDRGLRLQVEGAVSIIETVYKEQQKGLLTEQDARKKAADLIREIRYDNGNYIWIDTYEGLNIVLLGNKNFEGKTRWEFKDVKGNLVLQDLFNAAKSNGGGGFSDYWFPKPNQTEALPKRGYVKMFEPYHWTVGTGTWYDYIDTEVAKRQRDYEENLRNAMITQGIIGLLSLLTACGLTLILVRSFIKPLRHTQEVVSQMATGDLSVTINESVLTRKDEIGELAIAFSNMNENFKTLIAQVVHSSDQVAASSKRLYASAGQSTEAANTMVASTQQISDGMQMVSASAEEITASSENMGANISQIAQNAAQGSQVARGVEQQAVGLQKNAQISRQSAVELYEDIDKRMVKAIEEAKIVDEISTMAASIATIAGQTNLLALNAAIEAARAGEMGRGFAVVAEEVRKLAEESAKAVNGIQELTKKVQAAIGVLVGNSNELLGFIHGTVRKDYDAFVNVGEQYKRDADSFLHITTDIENKLQQVTTEITEVNRAIESVASTIVESASGTQEISQGTHSVAQQLQEISRSSTDLTEVAVDLNRQVSRFKVH